MPSPPFRQCDQQGQIAHNMKDGSIDEDHCTRTWITDGPSPKGMGTKYVKKQHRIYVLRILHLRASWHMREQKSALAAGTTPPTHGINIAHLDGRQT